MKRIQDYNLGVKLISGGILAVLVSICCVGLVAVKISSSSLLSIGLDNSERIAAYMAKATENLLRVELHSAMETAMSPDLKNAANYVAKRGAQNSQFMLKRLDDYLKNVYEKVGEDFDFYFFADRQGNIVSDSFGGTMREKQVNIGDRAYFAKAGQTGKPIVGDPVKSKGSGEPAVVLAIPMKDKEGQFNGLFGAVLNLDAFSRSLTDFKVGKTGYPFMVDKTGKILAHPKKELVLELNIKTLKGMEGIAEHMLAGNNGHDTYIFKGVHKQAGYAILPMTGWSIAVTQDMDELWAHVNKIILYSTIIGITILIVLSFLIYLSTRSIVKPINRAVTELKAMAEGEGDLTRRLPVSSKDEVGVLAHTFNIFIEKLQNMIANVSHGVHTLSSSSAELASVSEEVAKGSANTSERAASVSAAAEEMTTNMNSVSSAMEESAQNVNMVADSAGQMDETIDAIGKNTEKAKQVADKAVTSVEESTNRMTELNEAATAIGQVVETITEISEQVNLLSLNATIEAARAGEAGKGFAVVANEIKELAGQTSKASQDIKEKIDNIQATATGSMTGMADVSKVIAQVSEIVSQIAWAVEQQSAATHEISENIANASSGIEEVNRNVSQSAVVADSITHDITRVNQSSANMAERSHRIEASAEGLSKLAENLDELVSHFKIE